LLLRSLFSFSAFCDKAANRLTVSAGEEGDEWLREDPTLYTATFFNNLQLIPGVEKLRSNPASAKLLRYGRGS
jgi:hypothetical protein